MARSSADKSIPPALRAIGGWAEAEWFDASILEGREVVGISLPRLPGLRKQNFELAERLPALLGVAGAAGRKPAAGAPAPAGIGAVLEAAGVVRAVAFRRPRFFFDAAATLFFAEIPTANLKIKAADTLRRNLIANTFRGCVLACGPARVTLMAWPADEADVTAWIRAAEPPFPTHPQFEQSDAERLAAEPAPRRARAERAERERLLAELDGLRAEIVALQRQQSVQGAMETLGLDDARLKAMLLLLHPDKHGNSEAATEAAKWVNGLREVLKADKAGARKG